MTTNETRDLIRLEPRVIRLKDAHRYLGMSKTLFDTEVRPYVPELRIGIQGVGFDRLDLDVWFEQYKASNGRLGKKEGGKKPWRENTRQALSAVKAPGTSIKSSEASEFARALARATSKKRSGT